MGEGLHSITVCRIESENHTGGNRQVDMESLVFPSTEDSGTVVLTRHLKESTGAGALPSISPPEA